MSPGCPLPRRLWLLIQMSCREAAMTSKCNWDDIQGRLSLMPKVEVIIPAYNAAKYLPIAIESVIAQTFEDWRIVLVDDGSTDDAAEVVDPYRQRLGDKLLYIYQPNGGLPAARNTAIRNSTGEF